MTRSTNMEHVEVLRDLRDLSRAAIKAGDWKVDGACDPDAVLRRADSAIASLSAPQPPAGAQPVDGLRMVKLSDAWDYANGRLSWNDLDARAVRHEGAATPLSREHGSVQEMFNPSAPVGVERIAAEIRASLGHGATVATRRRWAIELEALAQQPASVDGASPYPTPRNRQEAAALARLALAYLGATSAHIEAAVARCETDLAAQQGGAK